jgi:hypothetical protein
MSIEQNDTEGDSSKRPQYQSGQLRNFISNIREEVGDSPDLIKQCIADMNALQRQEVRSHFEAKQEYVRQIANLDAIALAGIKEYGLQTLKWLFLLNAGAVAIVLTYIAGGKASLSPAANYVPILIALWPFAVGCVLIVFAGAASFFNFSTAQAATPTPESLHGFLDPNNASWPRPASQANNESVAEFRTRITRELKRTRIAAIACTFLSGGFFVYGVYRVLHAALAH